MTEAIITGPGFYRQRDGGKAEIAGILSEGSALGRAADRLSVVSWDAASGRWAVHASEHDFDIIAPWEEPRSLEIDNGTEIVAVSIGLDGKLTKMGSLTWKWTEGQSTPQAMSDDGHAPDDPAWGKDRVLDDGWIPWEGGECPVRAGEFVEVRFRNGEERSRSRAIWWDRESFSSGRNYWHWRQYAAAGPWDIIAYRLHNHAGEGQRDGWTCPINKPGCTSNCGSYGCGN